MVSIIGRRNSRFGTGRVMSQIRMQALFLPRASSASAGAPIGLASAAAMAPLGSGSFGIARLADDRGTDAGRDRDRQMALAEQQVDP